MINRVWRSFGIQQFGVPNRTDLAPQEGGGRNESGVLCHQDRDDTQRENSDPNTAIIALDKLQHMILERWSRARACGFQSGRWSLSGGCLWLSAVVR